MKKFLVLAAMAGCFSMIGCWEYDLAPKCQEDDDIIVGARIDLTESAPVMKAELQAY